MHSFKFHMFLHKSRGIPLTFFINRIECGQKWGEWFSFSQSKRRGCLKGCCGIGKPSSPPQRSGHVKLAGNLSSEWDEKGCLKIPAVFLFSTLE